MDAQTKTSIMEEIENKSLIFHKVSNVQYRIRCPFCGDSGKNPKDSHCYIKCDYTNPDEEIKYNCFLCNRGGHRIHNLLKAIGASPNIIDLANASTINRISSIKSSNINDLTANPDMNSPQVKFICDRLGEGFTYDDFSKFRIIWDMSEVAKYITDKRKLNTLPNNVTRINFMSDNKSMILSRSLVEDPTESQWRKFPLFNNGSSFYIIQTTVDLFTSDVITISIAEGIFDTLSAYKNFNNGANSVYVSSLGSNYINAIKYMIMKGFVGKNIHINIYIDHGINEKMLLRDLKNFRWLFGSIKVYKNVRYKDIGTTPDKIKLMEVR